jgi:hypothetical protein
MAWHPDICVHPIPDYSSSELESESGFEWETEISKAEVENFGVPGNVVPELGTSESEANSEEVEFLEPPPIFVVNLVSDERMRSRRL